MLYEEKISFLQSCLLRLDNNCDGAIENDGVGFSGATRSYGHYLANTELEMWNPDGAYKAMEIVQYHRKQLGLENDQIPVIERPTDEARTAHREKIAKLKREREKELYEVEIHKGNFLISFPFSYEVLNSLKALVKHRKFIGENKKWLCNATVDNLDGVISFLTKWEYELTPEVMNRIDEILAEVEKRVENVELSKEADADFEVEGLGKGLKLRPFQKAGVRYAVRTRKTFIADEMGLGKAQPLSSLILTPNGFVKMGDVFIGQEIISSQGGRSKITGVFPQGEKDVYEVEFTDGSKTRCTDEHLWNIITPIQKWRGSKYRIVELKEIIGKLTDKDGNTEYFIPMVKPITKFNKTNVKLDPYLLGLLIGDGGIKYRIKFSSNDKEIINSIERLLPKGMKIKHENNCDYMLVYKRGIKNPVKEELVSLGLFGKGSGEKYIPKNYLINSLDVRLAVLQGLLDTDGYISKDGYVLQFTSISRQLIEDVKFLVQSFGGTAKLSSKMPSNSNKIAYTLTLSLPKDIQPFRLTRKLELYKPKTKYLPYRGIKKIIFIGREQAQCISVSAEDKLYITDEFILTHNTVQALATLQKENAFPALIVCPASLKINWSKEAKTWIPDRSRVIVNGKTFIPEADLVIINYDIIEKNKEELLRRNFKAVVFDESHYLKNNKAKRTKTAKEIAKKSEIRLMLSGTPVLNRPNELISQLDILDRLNEFGGFWEFARRYCDMKRTQWGLDLSGASNLEELNEKLRSMCFVRRLKKDVLTELPDKVRSRVPIEIDNRSDYRRAEDDLISYLREEIAKDEAFKESLKGLDKGERFKKIKEREESLSGVEKAEHLVRIEKLKQLAVAGKMKAMFDWIDNFLESGEKLIIFGTHKAVVKEVAKKYNAPVIMGDTSIEARNKAVEDFQNDPNTKVIVLNIKAGGVGLTLTESSNVVFLELGWTPAEHDQAEDRAHRIGQKDSVTAWYLVAEETIEEDIEDLIAQKREVVNASTEGGEAVNISIMKDLINRLTNRG